VSGGPIGVRSVRAWASISPTGTHIVHNPSQLPAKAPIEKRPDTPGQRSAGLLRAERAGRGATRFINRRPDARIAGTACALSPPRSPSGHGRGPAPRSVRGPCRPMVSA
jgi:hypothetical protein